MNVRRKTLLVFSVVVVVTGVTAYFSRSHLMRLFFEPTVTLIEQGLTQDTAKEQDIEVVAEHLAIPWEIAFLPNGMMLVTERPGRLLKIEKGKIIAAIRIEGVEHAGEGGLLGMALHPEFGKNGWIYLYLTTRTNGVLTNQVELFRLEGNGLREKHVILKDIPGAFFHDGGRIAFGPDKCLYITTGDATDEKLAQDIHSLAGKILRLKDDGSIPADNPFGNPVWSYGHRNAQGLAWDEKGRLWATEHGRSGILSGLDELNLIERGLNYGWPVIQGDEQQQGMRSPVIQSGSDETWAPAGAVYYKGRIFFTGLRGESLYEVKLTSEGGAPSITAHFRKTYGRLRALRIGPDVFFYMSTSNTDGRGHVQPGDDKIIRINPEIFG
jgi:glucose/arabinose dehydrogenase